MRVILNSVDEKNDRFFLNPIVDRPFSKMRCSKVSLPNTVEVAHPDEDLRFTTKHGANTKNYIISLQDINSSDGNFWATRINERLKQQGINDWFWRYDDNVGKFSVEFPGNGTDSITFTKECRIFGITKGEVIAHVTYVGGKLEFTQQIGQSFPSTKNFVVEVADANENRKYYLSQDVGLLGKLQSKLTATNIQSVLNTSVTSIPSTTGGLPWAVTWSVTAGVGDAVTYSMNWAAHPAGLSGNYLVSYYYTNNNGYPETSETGLGSLFATKNTGTALPDSLSALGTVAYNFSDPPQISTDYRKTLTIPATEHTQANMVTLINGLAIDGLTASATGTNQYTLSYTPRTTATLTQYITGVISIWADNTVAGFTQNFAYTLNPFPTAPATLVITLPTTPERTDTFVSNVVNLVPYNHAYITCSISTEDCNASVGNDAVIAEVPHAGAFMERHHYENNSPYFLPITQKDALSSIEIGIIDDRGRDLKSRFRGAPYLVVLELE
jgi:flagellar biosynthesis protein FliQ